jgi:uncharacterized RDD family membrane protein YckC
LAFAVDALVINVVAWLVGALVVLGLSLLTIPEGVRTAIAAIGAGVALLWTAAYFVFFWSGNGQTPGNRLLGIMVRDAGSLAPLRARRAALRMLVLPLSALPLCAGFLLILVDRRRRALHDRIVRTVVVYAVSEPRPRVVHHSAPDELRRARANGGEPAVAPETRARA